MYIFQGLKALWQDVFGGHPSPHKVYDHSVTVEDLTVPGESILALIPYDQAGENARKIAAKLLGCPYVWGGPSFSTIQAGDVEKAASEGCDCSGMVLTVLRNQGIVDKEWCKHRETSDMAAACEAVEEPRVFDIAYYQGHVALVVGFLEGVPYVLSMSGGDSNVTSVAIAKQKGAQCKLVPWDYRPAPDFVCFMRPKG